MVRRLNSVRARSANAITSLFFILGIAFGALTLIVILSVMNGFQQGFIGTILQVSSAHVRVYGSVDAVKRAETLGGYQSFYPFIEAHALLQGNYYRQHGALVRAVPADIFHRDRLLARALPITSGSFNLSKKHSIVLGYELARHLSVRTGDQVDTLALSGSDTQKIMPGWNKLTVTGIFKSGYHEVDSTFAYIPLDMGTTLFGTTPDITAAVKLNNHERDDRYLFFLAQHIPDLKAESWREYNRAFFSALRIEKNVMILLVILIFMVVTVNIYHSMRRSIRTRKEEIAMLVSLGAPVSHVQILFIGNGIMIGFLGSLLGVLLGLLITIHVNEIIACIETAVNSAFFLFSLFSGTKTPSFSVFGTQYFYNVERIPVQIFFQEVLFVFLFGTGSASVATYLATRKILLLKPAEVLRDE